MRRDRVNAVFAAKEKFFRQKANSLASSLRNAVMHVVVTRMD
jgi:hypothetical protein